MNMNEDFLPNVGWADADQTLVKATDFDDREVENSVFDNSLADEVHQLSEEALERTLARVLKRDAPSDAEVKARSDAAWAEFNEEHEKWVDKQEREARKYTWIHARDIDNNTVICEQGFKSKRVQKYVVTERVMPRSRFDRHVVVKVDRVKTWRYEPQELVMVLA